VQVSFLANLRHGAADSIHVEGLSFDCVLLQIGDPAVDRPLLWQRIALTVTKDPI
jgi:hypothetical protein